MILTALFGCSKKDTENQAPTRNKSTQIIGDFKSRQYMVSKDEHITVFDIPDYWQPVRCWVYVNESINSSHMRCDDAPNVPMPEYGGTSDR